MEGMMATRKGTVMENTMVMPRVPKMAMPRVPKMVKLMGEVKEPMKDVE
jgi:hypothetical protein